MTYSDCMSPRWTRAFLLAALVWAAGMAVGYAVVHATRHMPSEIPILATDAELVADAAHTAAHAGESGAGLMAFIFRRNLSVFVWLLAGLLSAGTVTFAILLANGVALGHTIALAAEAGVPPTGLVNLLVPHGLLEVGTFCIAGAVGFQGFSLACDWRSTGWPAVKALRLGLVLGYGVVALAVAAGLETYVTGNLAQSMGNR